MIPQDSSGLQGTKEECYGKDIDRGFIYRLLPDRPPVVLFKIDKGAVRDLTPDEILDARAVGYNISRGQYFRSLDSKFIIEYIPVRHAEPKPILSITWGGEVKSLTQEERIILNHEKSLQHIYKSDIEPYLARCYSKPEDSSSSEEEEGDEEESSSEEAEEESSDSSEEESEEEELSEAEPLDDSSSDEESPEDKRDDLATWAYVFHQRVNNKLWVDMKDYMLEQIANDLQSSDLMPKEEDYKWTTSSFYQGELCPIAEVPKEECMFCCHPNPGSPQKSASCSSSEEDSSDVEKESSEEEESSEEYSGDYEQVDDSTLTSDSDSEESDDSYCMIPEDSLLQQARVHMELFELFLDRQIIQSGRVEHNLYCLKRFKEELEELTRLAPDEDRRLKCLLGQRELIQTMDDLLIMRDQCDEEEKRLRHDMNSLRMMIAEFEDLVSDDSYDLTESSTSSSRPPTPSSVVDSSIVDSSMVDEKEEEMRINGLWVSPICCGMVKASNGWVIDTSEDKPTVLGKFVPENDCLQPLTQDEVNDAKALFFVYNY